MKKLAWLPIWIVLLSPVMAVASNPTRFDLPVVTTTPAQVPVGSLPNLLAVTNATVAVCGYPATANGVTLQQNAGVMCDNTITTYTDSTLGTACDPTAQLTVNGTTNCVSTTGLKGAFGFWFDADQQTHMTYTVQTAWGTFGPYDILPGSVSGSGSGTVIHFGSGNLAPLFTTSVSNATTTPSLTYTLTPFAAHTFYGNNGASTATPGANLLGTSDWSPNAYVAGSGSAQVQTLTLAPAATALVAGLEVRWLPVAANTATAPTLNINGLGARVITKLGTSGLIANDLTTTAVADAIYDGTRWQLQNPQTNSGSGGSGIDQLTGDGTAGPGTGSQALTLATVNSNVGTCGDATHVGQVTLNAKGLTTACTPVAITAGSSLPTATAIGQGIYATAAGTTYQAANISKVPVEFYGAVAYPNQAAAVAGTDSTTAFQTALSSSLIGLITCQAGAYYKVSGLTVSTSNIGLVGTGNLTYGGLCTLVNTSASANTLSAAGTSSAFLTGNTFANLAFARTVAPTGTATGLSLSFVGGAIVQNVRSLDNVYGFYRHAAPGFGLGYWAFDTVGYVLGTEAGGPYYGFYDDSADGNAENSIVTTHSGVSCSGLSGVTSYGQILTGEAVNDNDTFDFNTAACTYGQVVNYTGSGGTFSTSDIHWVHSTHDAIRTSCFKISNTSAATDGSVEIGGGWCESGSSTGALVDIESSYGVAVKGVQISQHTAFTATHAIFASASSNLVLANNIITNFGTSTATNAPVELTGVTHSSMTGNTILANTGNTANLIWLTGNSTYNAITGNNLSGFAGNGIGLDAGSNFNNCCATNSIDTTNIASGVQVSDAGTSNGFQGPVNILDTQSGNALPFNMYAPNVTAGDNLFGVYGVANTTTNAITQRFFYAGNGSAGNYYGWYFPGNFPSMNITMYPNLSTVFGATTPGTAGPANGIAIGAASNVVIDGSGDIGTGAVAAATSSVNVNSPYYAWISHYWNGSASASDQWTMINDMSHWSGSPTNSVSELIFAHSGSSGGGIVVIPTLNAPAINTSNVLVSAASTSTPLVVGTSSLATSGANFNSPITQISGNVWHAGGATPDQYFIQDIVGAGTDPTSTLEFQKGSTGTSGFSSAWFNLPLFANQFGAKSTQSTVNCSTSGTAVFSEPQVGPSYKQVIIYSNACNGTASYTYPTAFVQTPQVLSQSLAAIATSVSTAAVTITGAPSTGFLELDGY